ncbi:MAG: YidC/Oxa1 family membrane protein insertase, partial [Oscillibacter sp.]|nr:YidC/Oxa1 family membrane protein insertase [Oscillibacter sp.]
LILMSAGSSIIFSKISMKTNQMAAQNKNESVERTNRMMMWMMPLMSLWIGFAMPVALCLYWVAQNLLSMVQEVIAGKLLKKDYEAARIAAEERARQEKEDEKRRKEEARLERARRLEEEKKGKKNKTAPKAEPVDANINKDDSKIGMRSYARGRAYDPNRFGGVTTYTDPDTVVVKEEKPAKKAKEENKKEDGQ